LSKVFGACAATVTAPKSDATNASRHAAKQRDRATIEARRGRAARRRGIAEEPAARTGRIVCSSGEWMTPRELAAHVLKGTRILFILGWVEIA
jgi:uncharacterized protein (DUF3084 family)